MDSIYILPYKPKHIQHLKDMHDKQGNTFGVDIEQRYIPKIGYIAFLGKTPIAAGFLRRVEPSFCQFDTFLTNPFFGSQIRHHALKLIVDELTSDAKDLKLHGILAFTKDKGIQSRAIDNGFRTVDQSILVKSLVTKTHK